MSESSSNSNKRGLITGFDGIQGSATQNRIKFWTKNQPLGQWRRIKPFTIKYTLIKQKWDYLEKSITRTHICPFGMKEFYKELLSAKTNKNKIAIPVEVKNAFGIQQDCDYDQDDIKLSCEDDGDKGFDKFIVLFCEKCVKEKIPKFAARKSTSSIIQADASIIDVQNAWDDLCKADPSVLDDVDVTGTIIPNKPSIIAGPNNRRFILRPVDHTNKNKDVHSLIKPGVKRPPPPKIISVEIPSKKSTLTTYNNITKPGRKDGKKVDVTVKSNRWHTTKDIASLIDPSISMFDAAENGDQVLAQNHVLSIILSGASKNLSQEATMAMYEESVKATRKYHTEKLGDIEVEGKKFLPPVRAKLNDKNISRIQAGVVKAFKDLQEPTGVNHAPYSSLKCGPFGKFYSIMNDGIQKFMKELNGVFIRTIDSDLKIENLPWALTKIPGGSMDYLKLISQLVKIIEEVVRFRDESFINAKQEFIRSFEREFPDVIAPSDLPVVFQCTSMENCDFEEKKIQLIFNEWPTALVADGCAVNPKAGKTLINWYGLLSPTTRCSGHAASGSIRRMTSSETMQVDTVVTFAAGLKPILKHFQKSGKSSSTLNSALEMLEMKQLKAVTWSPTRMANILTASARTVEILFPLSDVLVSTNVKPDESAYFLSPACLSTLHLMADLESVFVVRFLRKLDTNDATLIEVFGLTERFISEMQSVKTPLLDQFLEGLDDAGHGNIKYVKVNQEKGSHSIILNFNHRPSKRYGTTTTQKINEIKKEADALKKEVIQNLVENAEDQNQSGTVVEYASAFDLINVKHTKADRVKLIKQLHNIYGKEYNHTIKEDAAKGSLRDYEINIKYPPKIDCTEDELIKEFNSIWPLLNKTWLKFKTTTPKATLVKRFWIQIISEHAVTYPNLCDLLVLLLSVSPGTGPVERSFSKLAKICYKDRGSMKEETIENLYLISANEIKGDDEKFFHKIRNTLQKK